MKVKSGRFIIIAAFFLLVFGLTSTFKEVWGENTITSPEPGSTLTTTTVTFHWSAGSAVDTYFLGVGSSLSNVNGSSSWGNIHTSSTTNTSETVNGIPIDGNTLYVWLWWKIGTSWSHYEFIYQTQTSGGGGGGGGGGGSGTGCPDAWDKILTTDRYELVMGDEAVRDNETCLVWERTPSEEIMTWFAAQAHCARKVVGGRRGWHLPTVEEMTSVFDPAYVTPALPSDHPFQLTPSWYWSSTTYYSTTSQAWEVSAYSGDAGPWDKQSLGGQDRAWCVRGGQGHDAY